MRDEIETLAKSCGFDDADEMHRLIASVDLSTAIKRAVFNEWKREDGTKEGLLKLIDAMRPSSGIFE